MRKLTAYGPLDPEEQAALAALSAGGQRVDGRLDLLVEGAVPDSAVLVLEGVACRYRHRPSGARQITAYLLPGDLCDPDFVHVSRITHSVGTIGPCRIAASPGRRWPASPSGIPASPGPCAMPSSPRRRRPANG